MGFRGWVRPRRTRVPRAAAAAGLWPVVETGGDMPVTPTFLFSEAPVILDFEEWEALEHPPGGRDQ